MAIERINIEQFIELSAHHPVIDVRSPGEYNHAHFPGAFNLPLFSDEERAAVGTAYKQQSREHAIKIGLEFFAPKMKTMIEQVEGVQANSRSLLMYCWRGGMRSAAVAWLLDLYGYKIYTLIGGYKKFRNYVLDSFRQAYQFNLLGGYTGSGKTEVLNEMKKRGETVIDLEQLAIHKGSAFGNIGMPPQPTQEMFENQLSLALKAATEQLLQDRVSEAIWLEDESQRIGLVNIPSDLWKTMRQSPLYFLDISFEERLNHIVSEYGSLDREKMAGAILRISQRLGSQESRNALSLLSEGKTRESFHILLTYYDRWYLKGLHNRENLNSLLHTVKCDHVTPLNAKKLLRQTELSEKP